MCVDSTDPFSNKLRFTGCRSFDIRALSCTLLYPRDRRRLCYRYSQCYAAQDTGTYRTTDVRPPRTPAAAGRGERWTVPRSTMSQCRSRPTRGHLAFRSRVVRVRGPGRHTTHAQTQTSVSQSAHTPDDPTCSGCHIGFSTTPRDTSPTHATLDGVGHEPRHVGTQVRPSSQRLMASRARHGARLPSHTPRGEHMRFRAQTRSHTPPARPPVPPFRHQRPRL